MDEADFIRRLQEADENFALRVVSATGYGRGMDELADKPDGPRPDAWQDALACGGAEVEAGLTSSWAEARARLLAELEALEVEQARRRA